MDRTKPTGPRSGAGRWEQLLDACTDGLADGLRSHIPGALGIVLKTLAICISLLLAHILLGMPLVASGVGARAAGGLVYVLIRVLRFLHDYGPHR